jgi:hypothetical protein
MARVAGMAWEFKKEFKGAAFTQIRPQFAPKSLTLIERKPASSNRIAEINLNLRPGLRPPTRFDAAIRTSESNDNVENFTKNVAHDTLAVTLQNALAG